MISRNTSDVKAAEAMNVVALFLRRCGHLCAYLLELEFIWKTDPTILPCFICVCCHGPWGGMAMGRHGLLESGS